jgi:predicted outer membrane repeat protein
MGLFGMVTIRGERAYPAIILRGSGETSVIDAGGASRVLYIDGGNKITLENITLTGGRASTGAGIYAEDSVVAIGFGSVIKGNTGGFGGGICVEGGMLVVLGTVTGNSAENGGGIAMRGKTTLDFSGTVSVNTAANSGGGILIDGGTGIITKGVISGNTAERGSGGGIYLQGNEASLVINGGEVFDNHAPSGSGGGLIIVNNSSLRINSGRIQNNDAMYGGAIYLNNASLDLLGCEINGNFGQIGGGIYLGASRLTMSGGLIQNNRTTGSGGGIVMGTVGGVQAEFLMSGGEIRGNEAANSGGGVFFNGGKFTMSNGALVSGNSSSAADYPDGGGGYTYSAELSP